jgi:RimJ/RimL family protein N-acetyltransferase
MPATLSMRTTWRQELPTIHVETGTLREVASRDAASLAEALSSARVSQYLARGPETAAEFDRFISWVRRERRAGRYLCFGVVPRGERHARGLFQLWPVEPGFGTAEMGFALDPALWGTGLFLDCATAVIAFGIDTLGVRRFEFRSAVANARGTGALRKLGAVPEGTLRRCFPCNAGILDHTIWSILASEWHHGPVANRNGL